MIKETGSCEACKHDNKTPLEWPCINCINNARNHFEKETGGWIPCSELLPERNKAVIVYIEDRYLKQANSVHVGYYNGSAWDVYKYDDAEDFKVTAWQPLPDPYKESEE